MSANGEGGGGLGCRKFESFVGNLGGFAAPPKSEFPPLYLIIILLQSHASTSCLTKHHRFSLGYPDSSGKEWSLHTNRATIKGFSLLSSNLKCWMRTGFFCVEIRSHRELLTLSHLAHKESQPAWPSRFHHNHCLTFLIAAQMLHCGNMWPRFKTKNKKSSWCSHYVHHKI